MSNTATILTIEDERILRENMTAYLEDNGYRVLQAENGRSGLEVFRHDHPDLVLVDLRMPEINGLDVLKIITQESPETPIIVVSGTGDMEDSISALKFGAWDFLSKPITNMDVLNHAVTKALERGALLRENRRYREHLEEEVKNRTLQLVARTEELELVNRLLKSEILERQFVEGKLKESLENLRSVTRGTINTIARIGEIRDPYTGGHQRRVARLSQHIAAVMKLPEEQQQGIHFAGMLHDVGKIAIPIEILCKPDRLSELELLMLKIHPRAGWEILKEIEFTWPIADIVLQHHERLDGSGYPSHLAGEKILLEARIIGVADVVESMSSHRPYRDALGIDKALDEIEKNADELYDGNVVEACLKLFRDQHFEI